MGQLSNIKLSQFRAFLQSKGLTMSHTHGGHEIWTKVGLKRPVTFQTHVEPIPEFIIRNNLTVIGATRAELIDFLKK